MASRASCCNLNLHKELAMGGLNSLCRQVAKKPLCNWLVLGDIWWKKLLIICTLRWSIHKDLILNKANATQLKHMQVLAKYPSRCKTKHTLLLVAVQPDLNNKALHVLTVNTGIKNLNSHLLPLFISYRGSGEKLIKYQGNSSSCVIMSIILMTTVLQSTDKYKEKFDDDHS